MELSILSYVLKDHDVAAKMHKILFFSTTSRTKYFENVVEKNHELIKIFIFKETNVLKLVIEHTFNKSSHPLRAILQGGQYDN